MVDYELKAGTRIDDLLNDHILYTDGGADVCRLAEHDAALIHEELRALEQERDALREALETISRRVPVMGSTGDFRRGQLVALEYCRRDAQDALHTGGQP